MKINIGVSNRHVHLTKEDYDLLFGDEYKIIKNLSQPSDFVTDKVVTLKFDAKQYIGVENPNITSFVFTIISKNQIRFDSTIGATCGPVNGDYFTR